MWHAIRTLFALVAAAVAVAVPLPAQQDAKGCADHPFLSRMPNYYILECKSSDFDSYKFYDPAFQGKKQTVVEGRRVYISYLVKQDYSQTPSSPVQIIRNYESALRSVGGAAYSWTQIGGGELHGRYASQNREAWVRIYINRNGGGYTLTLIEKQEMAQDVVANAKFLSDGIQTAGHVAVYGIHFDFNKADIKPESEAAMLEIAKVLRENASMKLYVVGHTDNAGGLEYNMKLSQQRADAVVRELSGKYGVAADRLKAAGMGPLAPVASNDTEEGRARNRRVELVKQ